MQEEYWLSPHEMNNINSLFRSSSETTLLNFFKTLSKVSFIKFKKDGRTQCRKVLLPIIAYKMGRTEMLDISSFMLPI